MACMLSEISEREDVVMADTIIIGDGPGGLSAALFLARADQDVFVFEQDKTAMHWAQLNNYLGFVSTHGAEFQKFSREQVGAAGATIRDEQISTIEKAREGFAVTTEAGDRLECRHLILSEGEKPRLAQTIGLVKNADGAIPVDENSRSDIPDVYVVGRSTRPGRSQAIISAGDGAAAAIDILSRIAGKAVCDWDSPPSDGN